MRWLLMSAVILVALLGCANAPAQAERASPAPPTATGVLLDTMPGGLRPDHFATLDFPARALRWSIDNDLLLITGDSVGVGLDRAGREVRKLRAERGLVTPVITATPVALVQRADAWAIVDQNAHETAVFHAESALPLMVRRQGRALMIAADADDVRGLDVDGRERWRRRDVRAHALSPTRDGVLAWCERDGGWAVELLRDDGATVWRTVLPGLSAPVGFHSVSFQNADLAVCSEGRSLLAFDANGRVVFSVTVPGPCQAAALAIACAERADATYWTVLFSGDSPGRTLLLIVDASGRERYRAWLDDARGMAWWPSVGALALSLGDDVWLYRLPE